jgi:hypothetical protein
MSMELDRQRLIEHAHKQVSLLKFLLCIGHQLAKSLYFWVAEIKLERFVTAPIRCWHMVLLPLILATKHTLPRLFFRPLIEYSTASQSDRVA